MIRRNEYLSRLAKLRDKQPVKLLSGVRGSGKTTLLALYIDWLKHSGVDDRQIIFINMEDPESESLFHYQGLYSFVKKRLCADSFTYVFIDEIQKCTNFDKAIAGLLLKKQVDLYATVSSAGNFSTVPHIEIRVLPLSFAEYLLFSKARTGNPHISGMADVPKAFAASGQSDAASAKIERRLPRQKAQMEKYLQREDFNNYVSFGGFPFSAALCGDATLIRQGVDGIYNTILVKELARQTGINDIPLLEATAKIMSNSIGRPLSSKKISTAMSAGGRKISSNTLEAYMRALCSAFVFYQIGRFDIKTGKGLKTLGKYYIADTGVRNLLLESSSPGVIAWSVIQNVIQNIPDLNAQLENIVCMELLRRGFQVCIGKCGRDEINFVALRHLQMARQLTAQGSATHNAKENAEILAYVQVTSTMRDKSVYDRKFSALERIRDNCPKLLLSMDETPFRSNRDGIMQRNLIDWLLETRNN
jgi:predicted AAA+ superfamily ATPase